MSTEIILSTPMDKINTTLTTSLIKKYRTSAGMGKIPKSSKSPKRTYKYSSGKIYFPEGLPTERPVISSKEVYKSRRGYSLDNRRPANMPTYKFTQEENLESYWYSFLSSLDRKQDIHIIKELLLWGNIYHNHDSEVKILIPNNSGKDYMYYRRLFDITKVPCLILTDNPDIPIDYIKFSQGFLSKGLLGKDYEKLRNVMDYLHNVLLLSGELKKVKQKVVRNHISTILEKSWSEVKNLISVSIS